jgi:16S rRNA C967 or C1407 C5-methylase (RsmB/RsmF family)
VVYSTCSIHAEENESVVSAALASEAKKSAQDPHYQPFHLRPAIPVRLTTISCTMTAYERLVIMCEKHSTTRERSTPCIINRR